MKPFVDYPIDEVLVGASDQGPLDSKGTDLSCSNSRIHYCITTTCHLAILVMSIGHAKSSGQQDLASGHFVTTEDRNFGSSYWDSDLALGTTILGRSQVDSFLGIIHESISQVVGFSIKDLKALKASVVCFIEVSWG